MQHAGHRLKSHQFQSISQLINQSINRGCLSSRATSSLS